MKKMFIITALFILFLSCESIPRNEAGRSHVRPDEESSVQVVHGPKRGWGEWYTVKYRNHQYVVYTDPMHGQSMVHDPDCPCRREEK